MGNIIGNIMGNMCSIVEGNNDSTPTPATTKKHGKSGKSGIFTKYEQSDLIRLLYSYVIFGVIAFTLKISSCINDVYNICCINFFS